MIRRRRLRLALCTSVALGAVFAGCGGGGGSSAETVIDQTFSDHDPIHSADLEASLRFVATGSLGSRLDARLDGPLVGRGPGQAPKLDFSAKASVAVFDRHFTPARLRVASTGDGAYIEFGARVYALPQFLFDQIDSRLLDAVRFEDPQSLLANPSLDPDARIGGTVTNHVSGILNVDRTIEAVSKSTRGLQGLSGGEPTSLQLDRVKNYPSKGHFDLYTGKDDHILRRLRARLSIKPPPGSHLRTATMNLDIRLNRVNERQRISTPTTGRPAGLLFSQLRPTYQGLLALGALGSTAKALGVLDAERPEGTHAERRAVCGELHAQSPSPSVLRRLKLGPPPLALGDSVMLLALPNLLRSGYRVNIRGCRTLTQGIRIVRAELDAGTLPHLVAVALGADESIGRGQLEQLLRLLGPKRVLCLVTNREVDTNSEKPAMVVREVGRQHPDRVFVLDWVNFSRGHTEWFQPDGLHLTFAGARAYTGLLRTALPYAQAGKFPAPQ